MPRSDKHDSSRKPNEGDLKTIPWLLHLQPDEYQQAVDQMELRHLSADEYVARIGQPGTHWYGVIDGLLKAYVDNEEGQTITFMGVPPGGWFGEGTVLKRETYRYNIQALRSTVIAGLPLHAFDWLLNHSLGFNRFVMNQLNERLAQFINAREIERLSDPNVRVARSLAAMFNPVLYPLAGMTLRITQQELAYLVGLSRQRVNQAVSLLQEQGTIKAEYGYMRILDLEALRSASACP